jgi:arylsulfatase A-like enzyme
VIVLADDLGYGDLPSYGAPDIQTPNLDRLVSEGVRLTQFTVTAPLCTPSRGSLLTGRYPVRTGLVRNLGPRTGTGIDASEITLADALKARGYATAMIGKWGLGDTPATFLPTHHGFDTYYGIPSSADLDLLMRGDQFSDEVLTPETMARRYTEEAVAALRAMRDRPFFLYFATHSPHTPLYVSPAFRGRSARGLYGDVVEELDWSVGEIMKALLETGADRDTFVFFTSDNGPALNAGAAGGSAGPLSGGKGTPFEGGVRLPAIAWWPARLPAARVLTEPTSSLDIFPTFVALAGGQLSQDRAYDGLDIERLLEFEVPRLPGSAQDGGREFLYYCAGNPAGFRSGKWKLIEPGYWDPEHALFDLEADPGESRDLRRSQPDLFADLQARLNRLATEVARGGAPWK